MEVAADDPLRAVKQKLLRDLGVSVPAPSRSSSSSSSPVELSRLPLPVALAAARALVLRSEEYESWRPDAAALRDLESGAAVSPRNEAAALALLHAHVDAVCGTDAERRAALAELSAGYAARCGAPPSRCAAATAAAAAAGASAGLAADETSSSGASTSTTSSGTEAAERLQKWAEDKGLATSLVPAVLDGGLRGLVASPGDTTSGNPNAAAGATADAGTLPAGAEVLSLPAALLITYQTAKESDLGRALVRIPGLGDEAIAVVWTMVERHDPDSEAAPFWSALPPKFYTGLSAPSALVALLSGTPAAERFAAARAHLLRDFKALSPVFETLMRAYGQYLKVKLPNGTITPALAPYASLLNHSPWPHIVRFSEVDPIANALRLRLLRPAAAGEEVCLSYGPLPNEDLLLFYGFTIPRNPNEKVPVDLGSGEEEGEGTAEARRLRAARAAALRRAGLPAQVTLRPGWRERQAAALLPAARVLAAVEGELRGASLGAKGAWPERPLEAGGSSSSGGGSGGNEVAALALLEASARRAAAPYEAALGRVREALKAQAAAAATAAGGSTAAAQGSGSEDQTPEVPFLREERVAFLGQLETLLSGSVDLLLPPTASGN